MADLGEVVGTAVEAAKSFGPGVTVLGLLGLFWRSRATVRKLVHIVDDVAGEEARPGVPARPGLMERIERLERGVQAAQETSEAAVAITGGFAGELAAMREQQSVIAGSVGQLQPNGGSTMRDQLGRIETLAQRIARYQDPPPGGVPRQRPPTS